MNPVSDKIPFNGHESITIKRKKCLNKREKIKKSSIIPKNQWFSLANGGHFNARWDVEFPKIRVEEKATDKSSYRKKCIDLINSFLVACSDFFRPDSMELYAGSGTEEKFSIKNLSEFMDKINAFEKKICDEKGETTAIYSAEFHGLTNIYMYDEKTKSIKKKWYPDRHLFKEEMIREKKIKDITNELKDFFVNRPILEVLFDFLVDDGDYIIPAVTFRTESDIWLHRTLSAIDLDEFANCFSGYNNLRLAEMNNKELKKILRKLEKFGGVIDVDADSSEGGLSDYSMIYKYGFTPTKNKKNQMDKFRREAIEVLKQNLSEFKYFDER